MCSIAIKIPDEVLYDTKMTKDEANALFKKPYFYWILCTDSRNE